MYYISCGLLDDHLDAARFFCFSVFPEMFAYVENEP